MDPKKDYRDGKHGFVDIFVNRMNINRMLWSNIITSNIIVELKGIFLTGLMSTTKGTWVRKPNYVEMNELDYILTLKYLNVECFIFLVAPYRK